MRDMNNIFVIMQQPAARAAGDRESASLRHPSSLTYSRRGIPPRGVAHRSFMPNKLPLRALRSGRRARNTCHRTSNPGH